MHLKAMLLKLLKLFVSDTRRAIVGYIVVGLILAGGGVHFLTKTTIKAVIQIANIPLPLWVAIVLVLLVGVYTYLKTHRQSQSYSLSLRNKDPVRQKTKKYDPVTKKVIKLLFDADRELSINEISAVVSGNINTTMFHLDTLLGDRLIKQTQFSNTIEAAFSDEDVYDMYDITSLGRKYVVENGLS